MKENHSGDDYRFPPLKLLKSSFEFSFSNKKDITPLRTHPKQYRKTMIQTSIPMIGFDDHTYKFTIGQGNNHEIVRKVLNSRSWWIEIPSYNTLFNLNWQPLSTNIKFDRLKLTPFKQIVNHFEGQKELSSKLNLLINLQTFCEENRKFLFDIIPITYFLDLDHLEKFDVEFQDFLNCFLGKSSLFRSTSLNLGSYKLMKRNFYKKKGCLYSQPRNYATLNCGNNVWILKPADYNRGRGIRLFNTLEDLQLILLEYERFELENYNVLNNNDKTSNNKPLLKFVGRTVNLTQKILRKGSENKEELKRNILKILNSSKLKTRRFIIQKYIENPFLINERKFDMRVWVLLNHEMNVFFFREGYIRTSSEIYNLNENELENPYIHLTNNAIQKNSEKYGTFEKGNQLSFHQLDVKLFEFIKVFFKDFQRYLREINSKIRVRKHLVPNMKEIILLCFRAAQMKLNSNNRQFCFEIFGFDFMIDASFSLWLLEINTNPCLEESSPLLKQLIPRMLDDAFNLSIDVLFSPRKKKKINEKGNERVFKVNGYKDQENMWELVGDISQNEENKSKKMN